MPTARLFPTWRTDVTRAALSIVPAGSSDAKTWIGDATTINEEGKVIITDDASKETVSFVVKGFTEDAVFLMDIEGFGKAALVPITEEDYKRIAEVRELLDK